MKSDVLKEYSRTFHSDVASNAAALDMLREHAFVDKICEILADYGETEECEPCHWKQRGAKVDAYSFDDEHTTLSLVVSHWLDEPDPSEATVSNADITASFKRARGFFDKSLKGALAGTIDVANPAHDLANLIHECAADILAVRIVLVTDGVAKERAAVSEEVDGIEITSVVWDIARAQRFEATGEREQITINFDNDHGGPIPCVEQASSGGKYTTYLAFVPGDVLAELYGNWKIRLLERNVRVFLSQRPKVNQGIRDTIREEPDMFCAYNNGITVYAKGVELAEQANGRQAISRVHDFQIVNGGQTTASLYHTTVDARTRKRADLSQVSVQMKLMVIHEEARPEDLPDDQRLSDILVLKIGKFSNFQNRVQMADLLANDPPHPEIYAISQNLPAPDPTGGSLVTHWFYEKSRGSYEESKRLQARTEAQRTKFEQKYPKKQRFDKSRFGKAWNSYLRQPHVVCLGAMKNFARFNDWLQDRKDEDWTAFFRRTVALVMMWNEAERLVRKRKYGGYTHAIVAYSLAWLHELTDMKVDLEKVWKEQKVDEPVVEAIGMLADVVNEHIRDTRLNITEWCKKKECWDKLLATTPPGLPVMKQAFTTARSREKYEADASLDEANVQFCAEKGGASWKKLSKWLKDRDFMQGKQRSQCFNMGRTLEQGKKEPSTSLAYACRKIWEDAEKSLGWDPAVEDESDD